MVDSSAPSTIHHDRLLFMDKHPPQPTAREQVRQQYDEIAAFYDQRWQAYLARTLHFLKEWADLPPNARVLDVACGTGAFEAFLLQDQPTQALVGIDLSCKMLALAQKKCACYTQAHFHPACALALPFAAQSFDAIICANAFHYFDDPLLSLHEMKRVLRPRGQIVVLDWCKDFLACRLCDFILPLVDPAYRQCYTEAQVHHWLADTGLTLQRSQRIRFGPLWGLMVMTAVKS